MNGGGREVTASFAFLVLATSAAGLAPGPLQADLLQRLVGLKLPGFPRLFLISISASTDWHGKRCATVQQGCCLGLL
jgi:hypothetical protein